MGRAVEVEAAFTKGTTWGTPAAVGAADGLWLKSIQVSRAHRELLSDESLTGKTWGNKPRVGARLSEVRLTGRCRYGYNFPVLLAFALGTSGAPSGAGPYVHTVTLADRLSVFFSLVVKKILNASTTKYDEYASMMVEEVVLRWTQAGEMEFEIGLIGGALDLASSVNTGTEFGAVTMPGVRATILPSAEGVCHVNAQAGADFGGGDVLNPVGGEIRIRRPLARDFALNSSLAGLIALPVEAEGGEIMLTLDFPSLGAAGSYISAEQSWITAFQAETEYKADLILTKDVNSIVEFNFPRLVVVEMPEVGAPENGRLLNRVVLKALEASSAPTGMTATKPVEIYVTDSLSGAYI